MSTRKISSVDDPLWSLTWYMRGYYPLYDVLSRFYWERLPERAFLPINEDLIRRAQAMAKRGEKKFRIVKNQHFDACIRHLQNPRVKEYSWVRAEIVHIYRALRSLGLLLTLEAIDAGGELAGGLVAILFPGVIIAETMFTLKPDASKVCLCALVREMHSHGFGLMDVQTRHDQNPFDIELGFPANHTPHPCVRLGERVWPIDQFMPRFREILKSSGFMDTQTWLVSAAAVAKAQEKFLAGDDSAPSHLAAESAHNPRIRHALGWLSINLDQRFAAAVEAVRKS